MKVSLNTVQSLVEFNLPPVDELVKRINSQLGGVEEVIDLGVKYKDALIVKVVECGKHPDADKLSICKIDDGRVREHVERDEDGLVQVVCGAPNVHTDMWAVWLPPESIVPASFDDAEPFRLGVRELRGVMSNGMLAAGDELGINSEHSGIIEITQNDLSKGIELEPGVSFADIFGLNDTIVDIENKMFTHRPDLFGQLGVAREIAGILGHEFTSPKWYSDEPQFETGDNLNLEVFNEANDKVPRIMFAVMQNVEIKPSPLWLQCALVAMGSKAINNIVDATNYVMLMTAQPTHAYDYDKLRGAQIGARMAEKGENVLLLNGKTYELTEDDIVIADGEGTIGLGGIMGGGNSEVSSETKNIVLEVATFDMYAVRKSSMRYGLFTDALTRFNKGQSPLQNSYVLNYLMKITQEVATSADVNGVYDLPAGNLYENDVMDVTTHFVNERLGLKLSLEEMTQLLENVEFNVITEEGNSSPNLSPNDYPVMLPYPPFWRTDIVDPEDIVEEIGRLYGYDKLPRELPTRSAKPSPRNIAGDVAQKIRESLSRNGANEVLTYSFVHENIFKKAMQDTSQAYKISNALSPDLQYYRLTVLPSLLDKVHANIKSGHDEFVLFEVGKGHNKKYHADDDDGLPGESKFVDMVYASKHPREGAAFYQVRSLVNQLARDLGFTVRFEPISEPMDYPVTAPFEQTRSAMVYTARDHVFIGMVGELKQQVVKNFKLPEYTAAATLDLLGLQQAYESRGNTYAPLSRYPSTSQDISLKLASGMTYAEVFSVVIEAVISKSPEHTDARVELRDIYQAEGANKKTMTFRVTLTNQERTMTDAEVAKVLDGVVAAARARLGAERT